MMGLWLPPPAPVGVDRCCWVVEMMRCCCTGVSSCADPCPADVEVLLLLWPVDEVVDECALPELSSSPVLLLELFRLLIRWAMGWLPLDCCCTITLLDEVLLPLLWLLLLACGFEEIVPDEMWSIMEQRHVH